MVQIWGFYWNEKAHEITPELANRLIDFFHSPGPYSAYLVGGGSWNWRKAPDPKWQEFIYRKEQRFSRSAIPRRPRATLWATKVSRAIGTCAWLARRPGSWRETADPAGDSHQTVTRPTAEAPQRPRQGTLENAVTRLRCGSGSKGCRRDEGWLAPVDGFPCYHPRVAQAGQRRCASRQFPSSVFMTNAQ